jgi:riboflavin kinase/FMN adenylyltransferase
MRVFHSLSEIPGDAFAAGTAIAIGKFDGVHLGHRALLDRVAEIADARGVEPLAFTFANNPLSLLRPESCPAPIMSCDQRLAALEAAGVETCVMVPFDSALAEVAAEEFVERVLVGQLHVKHFCVGADFRFGHGGRGDPALLVVMGERLGFTVDITVDVEDPALGKISSSRVRQSILQGDVATASRMMNRWVSLSGEVVHGDARGREIGFPTANLGGEVQGLRPADGVYAGWALVEGDPVPHKAAISVGANVTFEPDGEPRVEAFLLDYAGDLYGKKLELRFVERLRGMVAFNGVEPLLVRMHEDVREAAIILLGAEA